MVRCAAVLVFGLCMAGCREDRVTTALGGVNISFDADAQLVKVVDDNAHVELGSDKYDLSVQKGTLTINGREYGPVAEGDDVWVSGTQVTINGKTARPLGAEK
jgi:hypothetical protein